jgi:hypothetical protein
VAGDGMTATTHRDEEVVLATEANRFDDIVASDTARDESWAPVDGAIPHASGFVIALFAGSEQGSAESRPQSSDEPGFDWDWTVVAHLGLRCASTPPSWEPSVPEAFLGIGGIVPLAHLAL